MAAAHSRIGASSAKRWMACPGSVKLSEGMPNYSSPFAEEGTQAHELAERILQWEVFPTASVDGEMLSYVELYTGYVHALGGELLIEHRFHLKDIHEDLFGTSDAVVWDAESKTLHVIDLKYGAGVAVEVRDNPQLLYYAMGALLETKYPARKVVMTIVQPRCPHPDGPIRSWEIDALDLVDWSADLLDAVKRVEEAAEVFDVVQEAYSPAEWQQDYLAAGDHCRWCPAAAVCPKLKAKAQETAKLEFRQDLSYDAKQLAESLELADVVEGWVKSVREFAYQEANHGRMPPGYKLVEKRATRKWIDDGDAAIHLAKYGLDDLDIWDRKMRTPAAIEKVIGKEGKDFLETLVTKESSGTTLVHESDPRPAARVGAAEDFGGQ